MRDIWIGAEDDCGENFLLLCALNLGFGFYGNSFRVIRLLHLHIHQMRSRLGVSPLLCPVEEVVRPKSHRTAAAAVWAKDKFYLIGMHFCIYQGLSIPTNLGQLLTFGL
jgi:hypothetical protein